MTTTDEYAAVRSVLERYAEASHRGDVPALRAVFHPAAVMNGYLGDDLEMGTPEPFFRDLEEAVSTTGMSEEYRAEITSIAVDGPVAAGCIVEEDLLGINYVNHFHLLETDDEWSIVAKTFTTY